MQQANGKWEAQPALANDPATGQMVPIEQSGLSPQAIAQCAQFRFIAETGYQIDVMTAANPQTSTPYQFANLFIQELVYVLDPASVWPSIKEYYNSLIVGLPPVGLPPGTTLYQWMQWLIAKQYYPYNYPMVFDQWMASGAISKAPTPAGNLLAIPLP
jgi:hypothetical protein